MRLPTPAKPPHHGPLRPSDALLAPSATVTWKLPDPPPPFRSGEGVGLELGPPTLFLYPKTHVDKTAT